MPKEKPSGPIDEDCGKDPSLDPRTDPMNSMLAMALAKQALDQADPDDDDKELTEAEREALRSLCDSRKAIKYVMDRVRPENEQRLPEFENETKTGSLAATEALPGRQYHVTEMSSSRDELLVQMETFEREEYVVLPTTYRKEVELGRGGQGTVFLAESLGEFKRKHALKIFSPHPYRTATAYGEEMKRMRRIASGIDRQHPNLVDIEGFPVRRGIYAMVMQLIDGFDLKRLIDPKLVQSLKDFVEPSRWDELNDSVLKNPVQKQYRLQPGFAVYIVEECLRGLGSLHEQGIVHGDIKPSNIMVDCNGGIKLIDMGSAAELANPPQHRNWTPLYAPPEYLKRGEWTEKSDLASLGYVLIELLSGRRKMIGPGSDESTLSTPDNRQNILLKSKMELPDRLTDILPKRAQRCEHLVNLCRRMIDPDPNVRFPSARNAIVADDGTFNFNKQLVNGDLAVDYASHIERWITEAKQAYGQHK